MNQPIVQGFFDQDTFSVSYVVSDPDSASAMVIDPVLNFDAAAGRTATTSADQLVDAIKAQQLTLEWVLETHVHADHLSASPYVRECLGGRTGIGDKVPQLQQTFARLFNLPDLDTDGSQFDRLFGDGDTFQLGTLPGRVLHTPGHTPGCVNYLVGDCLFVGDTLFMPDYGSARCDFPGGDAGQLYDSIQAIFALPDQTRLFVCHDYKAPGRDEYCWETTVGEQRRNNVHINESVSREEFIKLRESRDLQLKLPKLMLAAVQTNIRAGHLPVAEDNGVVYLKLPVNLF